MTTKPKPREKGKPGAPVKPTPPTPARKTTAATKGPATKAAAAATKKPSAASPAAKKAPSAARRAPRPTLAETTPGSGGEDEWRQRMGDRAVPPRDAPPAPPASSSAVAVPEDDLSVEDLSLEAGPAPAVVAQIRELEAQLDRMIDEASRRDLASLAGDDDDEDDVNDDPRASGPEPSAHEDLEITRDALPDEARTLERKSMPPPARASVPTARASVPTARASVRDQLSSGALPGESTVFDTARELLSSDFYLRKWGRLAMRGRSEEVDDFGFDPIYEQKARTVLEFLYTRYFRVETTGIERVPSRGRCLLVANHSGTLPLDGMMLKTAVKLEHSAPRDLRWLTEDFIHHMPFLGGAMNRLGAVRACQENAERLLAKEELVAVFPEGVKGIGKLFSERYRLQRFGRGGFIKLCLRTETPIVPVAIVGAEETNPLLFRIEYLSKALGLPYVPVTPTFPALGPLGLLPAPTKWQIHFGEPIELTGHGRDAAEDELVVGKLAERVRATIQGMLDRAVGARKSVFFG